MHRLPKLVANISSQFHHLVNTGLAVGSLVEWLPFKVANHLKIDKFEEFIACWLQMAPSDCNHLYQTMSCEILHPMVWGTSVNSLALMFKTINLFLPWKLIFWKSYQSWQPSKFSKAHISDVGNPSTTIFCHNYYYTHIEHILENITLLYYKEGTKVGSQNLATKFGFVPDYLVHIWIGELGYNWFR